MSVAARLPRPASNTELAVLRHPDRRTHWIVVWSATLATDLDAATLGERVALLHSALPMVGARLRGGSWHAGAPPLPAIVEEEPLATPALLRDFALDREPPLRIILAPERARFAVTYHHAAFDGTAILAVLEALMGGPLPKPAVALPPGGAGDHRGALARLLRPADPVAPSPRPPGREHLLVRELDLSGRGVTGAIAAACAAAAGAHNAAAGRPWRRMGISIGVRGPDGAANMASYRRVDLRPGDPVAELALKAVQGGAVPPEQARPSRALRMLSPLADRFSDSLLISNMGRQRIPGLSRLETFPVARGRSAVAFGSVGLEGGPTTLTIRTRDLSREDAEALLDDATSRLEGARGRAHGRPRPVAAGA